MLSFDSPESLWVSEVRNNLRDVSSRLGCTSKTDCRHRKYRYKTLCIL